MAKGKRDCKGRRSRNAASVRPGADRHPRLATSIELAFDAWDDGDLFFDHGSTQGRQIASRAITLTPCMREWNSFVNSSLPSYGIDR